MLDISDYISEEMGAFLLDMHKSGHSKKLLKRTVLNDKSFMAGEEESKRKQMAGRIVAGVLYYDYMKSV